MHNKLIRRALAAMALGLVAIAQGCAQNAQRFSDPELAVTMLTNAVRMQNKDQIKSILGPAAEDVLSSGDAIADRAAAENFVEKYDEKHKLVTEQNGDMTLVVGKNEWPCPIPLVRGDDGKWYWDIEEGREELINRRVGRNENATILTCQAIVDAQKEYVASDPNGDGVPVYATKFLSDPGKHNGLYWPTEPGEKLSPLGPLVADATSEGYAAARKAAGEPIPYHGYYFKILTSQGDGAPQGAFDYIIDGKMIGGFAVLAWPANYGSSGVMSFMASSDGVVYERDLGANTAMVAKAMTKFDPAPPWKKSDVKAAEASE